MGSRMDVEGILARRMANVARPNLRWLLRAHFSTDGLQPISPHAKPDRRPMLRTAVFLEISSGSGLAPIVGVEPSDPSRAAKVSTKVGRLN